MVQRVIADDVPLLHHAEHELGRGINIVADDEKAGRCAVLFERVQNRCCAAVLISGVKRQINDFFRCIAHIIRIPLPQLSGGDVAFGLLPLRAERQSPVSVRRCGLLGLPLREHHEKRRDDRKSRRCRRDTAQHGARDGDEHFSPLPLSMLRGRPGNHDGFSRRNPFKRAMDSAASGIVQYLYIV